MSSLWIRIWLLTHKRLCNRMPAQQFPMILALVLSGVALAGLSAWMVNKWIPEQYSSVIATNVALPINFENLPPGTNIANLERGRSYYSQLCMSCHGGQGDGKGEWAYRVSPLPVDFRNDRIRARSDQQLFDIISKGLKGTPMAGLENQLSKIQRWQIVEYIRHIIPMAKRVNL